MFVYDFSHVQRPFADVRARVLANHGAWLSPLAADAVRTGEELRLRVGPRGDRAAASKEVAVELGNTREANGDVIVPMRWKPTGLAGLFPELEAELTVAPFPPDGTHLSLRGNYDPPLGVLGRGIDRLGMHRIAEASIRSFLNAVTAALEDGSFAG